MSVLIWALLGPIVFGVTLLSARNRVALLGATLVLLTPLAIFFVITTYERWLYDQADLYVDGRTFLVTIAPPALAVNSAIARASRRTQPVNRLPRDGLWAGKFLME